MVFQTPQQHTHSDTAQVLEGALELLVTSMAANPFILADAMLFGIGISGDKSLKLIDRSANVHELLGTPTNKQEADKYGSIVVVVREWDESSDVCAGERAPNSGAGSQGFRMAVFASRYASAVIDFPKHDVLLEAEPRVAP